MTLKPTIIISGDHGLHNADLAATARRLRKGRQYEDVSTVAVIPTRGVMPTRVVDSWMQLMAPMNQPFVRLFVERMEVAEAYNIAIETILAHPQLSKFRYVLTMEEDNVPPPDGLIKLIEDIGDYAALGGLYFTKGPGGQPMIYGSPEGILGFAPQVPIPDAIQPCRGLGMGFTLFKLDLFRDKKIPKPWFKTVQEWSPATGGRAATQDLYLFENVAKAGYKVASDNRVKVGHYDHEGKFGEAGTLW